MSDEEDFDEVVGNQAITEGETWLMRKFVREYCIENSTSAMFAAIMMMKSNMMLQQKKREEPNFILTKIEFTGEPKKIVLS
jgi:hypothetical protein